MSRTYMCPNICGFAKVLALEIAKELVESSLKKEGETDKKYQDHLKGEQDKRFNDSFSETDGKFNIDIRKFKKNLSNLKSKFRKWNIVKSAEKGNYRKTFLSVNWNNFPMARKKEHSLANCRGSAVRYTNVQSYLPIQSRVPTAKGKSNTVFASEIEAETLKGTGPAVKPLQANIQNTAKNQFHTM